MSYQNTQCRYFVMCITAQWCTTNRLAASPAVAKLIASGNTILSTGTRILFRSELLSINTARFHALRAAMFLQHFSESERIGTWASD